MNTISTIGQTVAMDGRVLHTPAAAVKVQSTSSGFSDNESAEVAEEIAQNLSEVKVNVAQLQKLSDMTMGHKLQFNVNDELGKIVVKVIDPKTEQVIKEIPSTDVQKFQANMKKVIGLLFDEMI